MEPQLGVEEEVLTGSIIVEGVIILTTQMKCPTWRIQLLRIFFNY